METHFPKSEPEGRRVIPALMPDVTRLQVRLQDELNAMRAKLARLERARNGWRATAFAALLAAFAVGAASLFPAEGQTLPRFTKNCSPGDEPVYPDHFAEIGNMVLFGAVPEDIRVIDGDSLCLGAVEVRLKDVDAPEWFEDGAGDSAHYLRDLVQAVPVTCVHLKADVSYDRLVARCYGAWGDLGASQIGAGHATEWRAKK